MTKTDNVKTFIRFMPMMVNIDQNKQTKNFKNIYSTKCGLSVDIIT